MKITHLLYMLFLSISLAHAQMPNTVIAIIPGFNNPQQVAITPDGLFAYVADSGSNSVIVINTITNTVVSAPGLTGVFTAPQGIAITPNGFFAYVTNSTTVSVIDLNPFNITYNTIIHTITNAPTGFNAPTGITITPNGHFAYVADTGSNSVIVINTIFNTVVSTPALTGSFTHPTFIAITPNGQYAYVSNTGTHFPINPGTTVSVIDIASNTITETIPGFDFPEGIAATPNGQYVYVSNNGTNSVFVINTATNNIISAPDLNGTVFGATNIAITADGNYLYTANRGLFSMSVDPYVGVINANNNTVVPAPALTTGFARPTGIAITPNELYVYVTDSTDNVVDVIFTGIGLSPTNFSGCKRKDIFLTQIGNYNHLTWQAPTSTISTIVSYNIYRDAGLTQLVATVPASGILQYDDHNRNPNIDYTYYIASVDALDNVSLPAVTTVTQYC